MTGDAATIVSLEAAGFTHIDVRCRCGVISQIPFRMLRDQGRIVASTTFGDLASRLRCQACGKKPGAEEVRPWNIGMNFTPFMPE